MSIFLFPKLPYPHPNLMFHPLMLRQLPHGSPCLSLHLDFQLFSVICMKTCCPSLQLLNMSQMPSDTDLDPEMDFQSYYVGLPFPPLWVSSTVVALSALSSISQGRVPACPYVGHIVSDSQLRPGICPPASLWADAQPGL